MRIILSRKGFDSANGGIVSPIFSDGTMVTLPIPDEKDKDKYEDLAYDEISYAKILSDLKYKGKTMNCHVDPDLDIARRRNEILNWKPAFGQIDSSASYLLNTVQLKPGDIFLFFGNFHFVEKDNDKLKYIKRTGDFYRDKDLQVIWGYLQVDKIITNPNDISRYSWHPHSREDRIVNSSRNNMLITATSSLSILPELPGCGLLKFNEKRVLTLEGANKATWKYQDIYSPEHILGNRQNSVNDKYKGKGLYYAGIWQELGLEESIDAIEWAKSVIS